MVNASQSGFIQGRNTLDGIALTQEVIHQCKKSKKRIFLLKLDFKKVYDMTNWDCLLEVLNKRAFGECWIVYVK